MQRYWALPAGILGVKLPDGQVCCCFACLPPLQLPALLDQLDAPECVKALDTALAALTEGGYVDSFTDSRRTLLLADQHQAQLPLTYAAAMQKVTAALCLLDAAGAGLNTSGSAGHAP